MKRNIRLSVTNVLVFINVCAYIVTVIWTIKIFGNSNELYQILIDFGGITKNSIVIHHEYLRLVTAMFLHFNIGHLLLNMLTLYYVGHFIESRLGHLKLFILYFVSGLLSNLFSAYLQGPEVISCGASGAIFGLFAFLVLAKWYYPEDISMAQTTKTYIIFIVINLIFNLGDQSINILSHFSGFIVGLFIMFIYIIQKRNKII